ncbi:vWA domain-containing protein [Caulobacter sp. LARHSG274]
MSRLSFRSSSRSIGRPLLAVSVSALLSLTMFGAGWAQTAPDKDDDAALEEVIVSGMRVRQGGAQDVNHFRGEADAGRIPMPDTITPEGLMGDYDLMIPGQRACAAVLCLTGEAMPADLLAAPKDRLLVGLGFSSNVDAKTWKRAPLNLVAVVDKSGSMDGEPLDHVRASLRRIVRQLRPGDQISIVLYGDRSYRHLEPTRIDAAGRRKAEAAIDAIASEGSTNMEEGLRVGYDTAFASMPAFQGSTRVMLFTDEQPNVGAVDADSFMGMAQEASRRGVGLTTIGVGVQFDASLAAQVAGVRGGNLYFLRDEKDVETVFSAKLDTMVSELAFDVTLTVKPHPGYRISAVYGAPAEALKAAPDGATTLTVPTAFLSTNGGGLFVALAKAEDAAFLPEPALGPSDRLLDVKLAYVRASDGGAAGDTLTVAAAHGAPSEGLRLGRMLIDEFLVLRQATTLYHQASDEEGAYQALRKLDARLRADRDPRLSPERQLVGGLLSQTALLSGHASEAALGPGVLPGLWRVSRVGGTGDIDLRRGDRIEFGADADVVVHRRTGQGFEADEPETYRIQAGQVAFEDSKIVFDYRLSRPDGLVLTDRKSGVVLTLIREPKVS